MKRITFAVRIRGLCPQHQGISPAENWMRDEEMMDVQSGSKKETVFLRWRMSDCDEDYERRRNSDRATEIKCGTGHAKTLRP